MQNYNKMSKNTKKNVFLTVILIKICYNDTIVKTENSDDFETVPLGDFYDGDETSLEKELSTNLVVLTNEEQDLVNEVFDGLKTISPESLVVLADRIADLEKLTLNIAHFPSLKEAQEQGGKTRDISTLVESLLIKRDGDKMLHLPSKAILGKGFIVAKFHTFCAMEKIATHSIQCEDLVQRLRRACLDILFNIMAEDVYISLLDNESIAVDLRKQIAFGLISLWERRSDQTATGMAPVLDTIWNARRNLTPALGTMIGTSELLLLTMAMDEQWCKFIAVKMGEEDAAMAMEEFLFGISYEEIQKLRSNIRKKNLNAIGRDEAAKILGRPSTYFKADTETEKESFEPRDFYLLYSIRRENARARQRLELQGPHYTLEDHYMHFILETDKDSDTNKT